MNEPEDGSEGSSNRPRGQFGIGRLMVLTAVVAVIMTIAVRLNAPKIMQGLLVGYLFFFAIWAVIRGPSVYADLVDVSAKRRRILRKRRDLERELDARKNNRATDLEN